MADLDTLCPEVRDAVNEITFTAASSRPDLQKYIGIIRAELLWLAEAAHLADGVATLAMQHRDAAEAELAALKARIAESAHVDVTLGCAIDGEIPPDLALCKVALVKVEE